MEVESSNRGSLEAPIVIHFIHFMLLQMRLCWVLGLRAVLFLSQGTNCARRLNNYNYNYNKHYSDYSRLLRSPRRGIEPSMEQDSQSQAMNKLS